MKFGALLLSLVLLFSCGGDDEPSSEALQTEPSAAMVNLNTSGAEAHTAAMAVAELILGEGGVADLGRANRELPLTTEQEVQAWIANRNALRIQVDKVNKELSKFALKAGEMQTARQDFFGQQSIDFRVATNALEVREQPLILAVLAVATLSIGAYRFLSAFAELADKTQRMVYSTAEGGEPGRLAVIKALQDNGATVSDTASPDEVIAAFKELPRDVRRTVTTKVEEWNSDEFFSNDEAAANNASGRFEEARDDVPEISNEAGAFAVTQTVSLVQAVTGGIGGIQGGVPGAVADLALTAAELNPTDIVQRNVTVYATGGDKVDLPSETSPTSPAAAGEVLKRAADGDATVEPAELQDAAVALAQEVAEALTLQFGPSVQLAEKLVLTSSTLDEEKEDDGSYTLKNTLPLPYFENDEPADVVVIREGILAHEASSHVLGPQNPLNLDSPPLAGTMTVSTSAASSSTNGSQIFTVDVNVVQVSNPTSIFCSGSNLVCSPSSSTISTDGTISFSAEVIGTAQLVLTRRDNGESYTKVLTAAAEVEQGETCADAKAHLCGKLPQVNCDISVMGTAKTRVIAACGNTDAQAFFSSAPTDCC